MRTLLLLSLVLLLRDSFETSPFEWTEKYIQAFQEGMAKFQKEAAEYKHEEGTFDETAYDKEDALKNAEEYDFVVIGAGSAGAVIANRLSEVPEWRVLLLEAGAPENEFTEIPAFSNMAKVSHYSWGYEAEPATQSCLGMKNHKCVVETGKALGGSSAINGMIYTRGNAKDFDEWADHGNNGWCYDDVLPYFKKSENAHLENFDRNYHNQGGPMHIEDSQFTSSLADVFIEAGKELGLKETDYNGKEQVGVRIPQVNTKQGRRDSTGAAFLKSAVKRNNLVVKPLSHVTKILVSPHTKEAYAVEYLNDGHLYIAKTKKEVILSAGVFNSPQLLMLSGVGPKEKLDQLEIPCLVDLPGVGQNLRDHVGFLGLSFLFNSSLIDLPHFDDYDSLIAYLKNGKGPLTTNGIEALAFVKTEKAKDKHPSYPDIELIFSPYAFTRGYDAKVGIEEAIYQSVWEPLKGEDTFSIIVMLLHPKSSGFVTIKSKDPLHWPIIHQNQLTDEEDYDIDTVLAGIRYAQKMAKTKAFQEIDTIQSPHVLSTCANYEFDSDDYWRCAIRHISISLRHLTGTSKMGQIESDKNAVVDKYLRVHGIHKLRVADASVIPVTISGHTHAATVMVGEKAADLIKAEWK